MKIKTLLGYGLSLVFTAGPMLAWAAGTDFKTIVNNSRSVIFTPLVSLLLTSALVVFFWGMILYIKGLSEKDKKDGKTLMMWGIIALFVMVSVWGIVNSVVATLSTAAGGGWDNTTAPTPVQL